MLSWRSRQEQISARFVYSCTTGRFSSLIILQLYAGVFRISAVRFISRQLTGARIRPGVIALLICVYLNESKPCRITAHNCSVPLLDHSLTTSFLPLSPSVSILCFHSLPCLFILHLMPTALFCLFFVTLSSSPSLSPYRLSPTITCSPSLLRQEEIQ